MLQDLGWFELSTAARAFIIVHTILVILAIMAVMTSVIADDPWVRRLLNRRLRRHRVPVAGDDASPGNPIGCVMPRCRRCGEVFWQTRKGVIVVCRDHAVQMRYHLDRFLNATR